MWIVIAAGVDLIKITAGRLISLLRCNAITYDSVRKAQHRRVANEAGPGNCLAAYRIGPTVSNQRVVAGFTL